MSDLPVFQKEIIKAGEPITINFPWFENGSEYPISDYTVSIMMRRDKPGGAEIAEWVDAAEAITRTSNEITLTLSADFTSALKCNVCYMDCWLKKSNGDGLKSAIIEFTIDRGVTR